MGTLSTPFQSLATDNVTIIVLGQFNPTIFHPEWLARYNLIRPSEAEGAKVEIVHADISISAIDWFKLQVSKDQFVIETNDPTKKHALRDLALGIFQLLEHTPVSSVGLNSNRHYQMPSEEEWHAFGDFYAPKPSWKDILNGDQRVGLRHLSMLGSRKGCDADRMQISVAPSTKSHPGIFLQVNQHYNLVEDSQKATSVAVDSLMSKLKDDWEDFLHYSDEVANHLWTQFRYREGKR